MINLDPSIIDQDKIRKQRRKKLLFYALTPVIILFLAGLFFLRPCVFDALYSLNYDNENAGFNIFISGVQTKLNIIEPYIAHYSAGTAYIKDNDGVQAEKELRKSLEKNPPADKVCQVRTNLSYSIEMQADQANISGHPEEALVLFSTAEGILYGDNCASKQQSSSDDNNSQQNSNDQQKGRDGKAEAAKQRISQKRNKIVSKMNGQDENGQESDPNTDIQISEEQLNSLKNNLTNGTEVLDYTHRQQRGGGGAGGGAYSTEKHW